MKNIFLIFAVFLMLNSVLVAQSSDLGIPKFLDPIQAPAVGYPGIVRVRVEVDAAGNIIDAVLYGGSVPVCSSITRPDVVASRDRALELVREMKFKPGQKDGSPAPMFYIVPIEFIASKTAQNNEVIYGVTNDPREALGVGKLNGKAVSLPAPAFPPAARAVRASGVVQVQVMVDEDGEVFSAKALSGHPLLQAASVSAACGAKFTPILVEGKPVKVSGIITYNFVP